MFGTIVFLSSCKGHKDLSQNVIGKYVNAFEHNAVHFVELYDDSSFLHYYKKNDSQFENRGHWKFRNDNGNPEISFTYWKSFGENKDQACVNGCLAFVKMKNSELIFDGDLPDERNFKKTGK